MNTPYYVTYYSYDYIPYNVYVPETIYYTVELTYYYDVPTPVYLYFYSDY